MTKTSLWTLLLSLALTSAAFAATDVEKCQKKKLLALGKWDLCLQKERGKELLGKTPNVAGCAAKFDKMIAAAEKKSTCRWLDNGDGTATDLNSGLQWELKTGDGSIHDQGNLYTWSDTTSDPDGGAFVDFLGTLNGGESGSGVTTTGCFADKCDWRLATIEELADIVDLAAFNCGSFPCTTIPGETQGGAYWSSSTDSADPDGAWSVHFAFGLSGSGRKDLFGYVRAVRGGS